MMNEMTRRDFLGTGAAGIAATVAGMPLLAVGDSRAQDSTSNRRQNMYSVVRVTVKETRQYCPFYQPGDVFFVRQQCFDPATAAPAQFCMHSLNDIYETYMDVRRSPVGTRKTIGCADEGIAQFEIERLEDEAGPGWNRPPAMPQDEGTDDGAQGNG